MTNGVAPVSADCASVSTLRRLCDAPDPALALAQVVDIFFESSSRTEFASEMERDSFRQRWLGSYVENFSQDIWLCQERDGIIAGYLTGCRHSAGAEPLYHAIPSYAAFADCFAAYPAHLHVNCRQDRRGQGVGARLVAAFASVCRAEGLPGVHIVTAPDARNVRFYARAGFHHRVARPWSGRSLLFMGRDLTQETLP